MFFLWKWKWKLLSRVSLWPLRLYSPWNSPGQNTGVGSLSLFQGIFPTQGSNPGLPHCRQILYQLSHKGSPRILEWVAYPFSKGSSWPRNPSGVSCSAGGFFTNWAIRDIVNCNHWKSSLQTRYWNDFFGRNDAKAETPVLWPPHTKSWLIGKDSDAGRDWGQEGKGTTEDEMAGWHHWLDGHESEMDREAWRAAVHRVTKSRTQLRDFSSLLLVYTRQCHFLKS